MKPPHLSESGFKRVQKMVSYEIPEEMMYWIDKIIREQFKEDTLSFPPLSSDTEIKEVIGEEEEVF